MDEVFRRLDVTQSQIDEFCARWGIARLEVFGSVLRSDFAPESDVDLLVTFAPGRKPRLRDLLAMEDELRRLLGRQVDLIKRELVEESPNWIRRQAILESARAVYAA